MIKVIVRNDEDTSSSKNIRVHRVGFSETGIHAEDGVILEPGEEQEFIVYGTINDPIQIRLAIEEEYTVDHQDPVL